MTAPHNKYKAGDWNALCDSCGFKFKSSELRKRWDGLMVDDACWETRQPQELIRAVKDPAFPIPWVRSYDPGDGAVVPYVADGYVDDDYVVDEYS